MQDLKIVHKRIGYSNITLLVHGSNSVLIDTGVKRNINGFKVLFKQFNLKATDIKLIILTHSHYDHTDNLNALKEITGAKILVHKNEFKNLKNGFTPIPKRKWKLFKIYSRNWQSDYS